MTERAQLVTAVAIVCAVVLVALPPAIAALCWRGLKRRCRDIDWPRWEDA